MMLGAEELLTTTRAVRKRLDFSRPVPRELLRECVAVALQAPSGSNRWPLEFVIVTEEERRRALGDAYRDAFAAYRESSGYIGKVDKGERSLNDQQQRTAESAEHLAANFHRAPAIVLACSRGRVDGLPAFRAINLAASVHPGMWSFMLAARLRGLGTCWTSVSLIDEARTAEIVGVPHDEVTICAITPVAYMRGDGFKPAPRPDPDDVIHWEVWTSPSAARHPRSASAR
jgi:nitroreductase